MTTIKYRWSLIYHYYMMTWDSRSLLKTHLSTERNRDVVLHSSLDHVWRLNIRRNPGIRVDVLPRISGKSSRRNFIHVRQASMKDWNANCFSRNRWNNERRYLINQGRRNVGESFGDRSLIVIVHRVRINRPTFRIIIDSSEKKSVCDNC